MGITSQGRRQQSIQREKDQEAVLGAPGRPDAKQRQTSSSELLPKKEMRIQPNCAGAFTPKKIPSGRCCELRKGLCCGMRKIQGMNYINQGAESCPAGLFPLLVKARGCEG